MIEHILAVIGALSLASTFLLACWVWVCHWAERRARKRGEAFLAALYGAIERHPAGRGRLDDHRPWDLPAPCCGGRIYGDSLPELLVNRAYHESMCPFTQRKAA